MKNSTLDSQLDRIEQQFNELSTALTGEGNRNVVASSATLQQLTVEFLHMVEEAGRASLKTKARAARIKTLAGVLPMLQANVMRRCAYVDRALETIIPNAPQATYGGQAKPYGAAVRQSGAFKVLSA